MADRSGEASGTQRPSNGSASRLLRPQVLRDQNEERRASTWLELFFDLCFVVAVAALARGLHDDPTLGVTLGFLGLFVPVWWAWMGFTWYASAFDNDDVLYRTTMLAAMLCVLGLAASIEAVLSGDGAIGFVLAYVGLRLLLVGLYARARRHATGVVRRYCAIFAVGNSLGAAIWLASVLVPEPTRYGIWAVALLVEIVTPVLAWRSLPDPKVSFHPEHVPERYGLFTIIVLGESVLAVAAGTAGTEWALAAVAAGVFGFVIAACMWWLYFDYAGSSALTLGMRSGFFWGYAHLVIYASIAAFGVGTQFAMEGAARPETAAVIGASGGAFDAGMRAILAGGVAVYLVSVSFIHWVNRRSLDSRVAFARLGVAAGMIGLAAFGSAFSPLALVGLMAFAMVGLTAFEIQRSRMPGKPTIPLRS